MNRQEYILLQIQCIADYAKEYCISEERAVYEWTHFGLAEAFECLHWKEVDYDVETAC